MERFQSAHLELAAGGEVGGRYFRGSVGEQRRQRPMVWSCGQHDVSLASERSRGKAQAGEVIEVDFVRDGSAVPAGAAVQ